MKRIDITDKLNFDESPILVIKGEEFVINDDAITLLKVMGVMEGTNEPTLSEVMELFDLLFPNGSREKFQKIDLKAKDFATVVEAAMDLVTGTDEEEEQPGELQSPGIA